MHLARTSTTILILTIAAATASRAQEDPTARRPSRDRERIERATIELERFLPWGENDVPAPPRDPAALAFTGDGSHVVLQIGFGATSGWTTIDTASGRAGALDHQGGLFGGVAGPRVVACEHGGLALVTLPGGQREAIVDASPPQRIDRNRVLISNAGSRAWFVNPAGTHAVGAAAQTVLRDLENGIEVKVPGALKPFAVAWHEDTRRFALVLRKARGDAERIEVFDFAGTEVASFAAPGAWGCELDVAGKHVFWAGPTLCRGDLATGRIEKSAGPTLTWFWQIDPVLGVGCDGVAFHLFDLTTLEAVRRIPLGEAAPAGPATSAPGLLVGCVLLPGAAASRQRDRIAVATLQGIRIFAVKR